MRYIITIQNDEGTEFGLDKLALAISAALAASADFNKIDERDEGDVIEMIFDGPDEELEEPEGLDEEAEGSEELDP